MAGSVQCSSYPVPPDRVFVLSAAQETVDVLRAIHKILESAEYSVALEVRKDRDGSLEVTRIHREQKFLRQKGDARKQFSKRD